MHNQFHKLIYAQDILLLNEENQRYDSSSSSSSSYARTQWASHPLPFDLRDRRLFAIALPPNVPEVKRFETSRAVIFDNVRLGFAAAYDALVEDRTLVGQGYEIAKSIWPDSILDSPPKHLQELKALEDVQLPPKEEVFHVLYHCV